VHRHVDPDGHDEREVLERALTTGQYREKVLGDEELASELGLSGVPAMLLRKDGEPLEAARYLSGAQPEAIVRYAIGELL